MNILLIGSGGREHALAWKLASSPSCDTLYAAHGNPGTAHHAILVAMDGSDHDAVRAFCQRFDIGLVVVGPEAPLVAGLADVLRDAGIAVFGPSKAAAQLEGSKGFVKDLCTAHAIPTAAYARHSDKAAALADVARFGLPVVIKADGLAAGKGVIIATSADEARAAIEHMFGGGFGDAGASVVIEAFMEGEEVSFFALSDGRCVVPFGSAQDHKRVGEGDTGPNTGGMGAYSPATVLTGEAEARVMAEIIEPTVRALRDAGTPYRGVLFAGLMLTRDGPKLIEYNCRFGDPEAQVLMMRYRGDLAALMLSVAQGRLDEAPDPCFCADVALTVVMATKGYPGKPETGGAINLPKSIPESRDDSQDVRIFHSGTGAWEGQMIADGGRVLSVTARGRSVTEAQARAYAAIERIDFTSGFFRRDIGWREAAREAEAAAL
ncbi:MAG: phosphoribosylamine--glycine ligase [Sphingopyxis sp.]